VVSVGIRPLLFASSLLGAEFAVLGCRGDEDVMVAMAEAAQKGCVENRQPLAASSSSLSDGSSCGGGAQAGMSPPVSSLVNSIPGLR
jgi:hypothetical protein